MKNEIKPTYVSFEQAKWLKEKGFKSNRKITYYLYGDKKPRKYVGGISNSLNTDLYISAPEQWQVVEFLRINHNVHIRYTVEIVGSDEWLYGYNILYLPFEFNDAKRRCPHMLEINSFKEGMGSYTGAWDTPQEAYSAAFDYLISQNII